MKTKNAPVFEVNPHQFVPPKHDGPYETMGRWAVITHEIAVRDDLAAGHIGEALRWAEQTEEKLDPHSVSKIRLLGHRALGYPIRSPEESQALHKIARRARPTADFIQEDARAMHEQTAEELKTVRSKLSELTAQQRADVSGDMIAGGLPILLRSNYVRDAKKKARAEQGAKKSIGDDEKSKQEKQPYTVADWLAADATDDQLMNALQWHNYRIESMQTDPELTEEVFRVKTAFKADVTKAVENGWLSEKTLEHIDAIDTTKVVFQDVFETTIKGLGGYHDRGSEEVIVAAGAVNQETIDNVSDYLTHEITHKEIGSLEGTVVKEALTEHIRLALQFGEPDIIDPDERYGEPGVYKAERILLADFLEGIDPAIATRAYSGTDAELELLEEKLNARWMQPGQKGALMHMNRFLQSIKEVGIVSGYSSIEAQARAAQLASETLKTKPEAIFYQRYPDESPNAWVLTA